MAYENMGNEQLVYLSLANQTLIARGPGERQNGVRQKKNIEKGGIKKLTIDD